MILGKVNIDLDISKIEHKGNFELINNNLYDTLISLAKSKSVFLINNRFAYVEDLRPDYKNGELYIPLFNQDSIEVGGRIVYYNNRVEKVVVHNKKQGFLLDYVYVLPNINIPVVYKLQLRGTGLSHNMQDYQKVYGEGSLKDLHLWSHAMGIDWMNTKELAQAIPPIYTQFIGEQLINHLNWKGLK